MFNVPITNSFVWVSLDFLKHPTVAAGLGLMVIWSMGASTYQLGVQL